MQQRLTLATRVTLARDSVERISATRAAAAAGPAVGRGLVAAAFATLFGLFATQSLLEIARDTLFLQILPVQRLPFANLGVALLALGLLSVAGVIGGRRRSVPIALAVGALFTFGLWAALPRAEVAITSVLFLWTGVFTAWVSAQLWAALTRAVDIGQAKRLFGTIGAGAVLGAVAGALLARGLTEHHPVRSLLLAAAVVIALTLLPAVWAIARLLGAERGEPRGAGARSQGRTSLRRQPYVERILAFALAGAVAIGLVEYLFKTALVAQVPRAQLGPFVASLQLVTATISTLLQLVGLRAMLRLLRLHGVLALFPGLLAVATGGLMVTGAFPAVVLMRGLDGAFRQPLFKTLTEILSVPLPDAVRRRTKAWLEVLGGRGGQGLASLLVLASLQLTASTFPLLVALVLVLAAWLVFTLRLKRPYLDLFRDQLRAGGAGLADTAELAPLDLDALEALIGGLSSPNDAEVLAALDLLAQQQRARLIPTLILYHPSPAVVLRALELLVTAGRRDFLPMVDRLLGHPEAAVRAAALRARVAVDPTEAVLRAQLKSHCPALRATAVVLLAQLGYLAPAEAQQLLAPLQQVEAPEVREALVLAIAGARDPQFEGLLLGLLASSAPALQSLVVGALADLAGVRAVAAILPMLARREVRAAARAALRRIGAPAFPVLATALGDRARPLGERLQLPRALAAVDPKAAARLLLSRLLAEEEGIVRYRCLRALVWLRRHHPEVALDKALIARVERRCLESAFRYLDWKGSLERAVDDDPARATRAQGLICALLEDKQRHAVERLFLVFGLASAGKAFGEDFPRLLRGLRSLDARARAGSLELLENLLEGPIRQATLAVVSEGPLQLRLARAEDFYRSEALGYHELLDRIGQAGGDTLGAFLAQHRAEAPERARAAAAGGAGTGAAAGAGGRRVAATVAVISEDHGSGASGGGGRGGRGGGSEGGGGHA